MFPLYILPIDAKEVTDYYRLPNLGAKFVRAFSSVVGIRFIPDGAGDLDDTFGPKDIFDYVYAIMHSPEYRRRYANFLKSDYPRVRLPGSRAMFADLVQLGARLARLHLLEEQSDDAAVTFPVGGGNTVERVLYTPPDDHADGRVWINRAQYFAGVTPEDYGYVVGGYRPAEKWLKDRKGRPLQSEDITTYCTMVAALVETRRSMGEIDAIIERHGGWPAAFKPSQPAAAEPETLRIIPFRPPTVEPTAEERYRTCVPLIPLEAAAGGFGDPQHIGEHDDTEWVAVASRYRLRPGVFVARVVGKSMEPTIPDGSWCLFRAPVEGTRQGKTVLVQLRGDPDPDTGERYTVKRYTSEKAEADADGGWRHARITLKPTNADFHPIVLSAEDDDAFRVTAEFLEVVRGDP